MTRDDAQAPLPTACTADEVAAALGVSRRTFDRWRRVGAFPVPPLEQPGHPRWSRAAIQRFLDGERRPVRPWGRRSA